MADTDTQSAPGYFGPPLLEGQPLAKQRGMARKINLLCDVLEGIRGLGVLQFFKPRGASRSWALVDSGDPTGAGGGGGGGGEIPTGYEEREDSIIDMQLTSGSPNVIQVKRGTVLVKEGTETEWTDLVSPTAWND